MKAVETHRVDTGPANPESIANSGTASADHLCHLWTKKMVIIIIIIIIVILINRRNSFWLENV